MRVAHPTPALPPGEAHTQTQEGRHILARSRTADCAVHDHPYAPHPLCLVSPLSPIVPRTAIIPNFPFFFCAWRAWSHYRAFKASQYLESFVAHGAVLPQPSAELDAIYAENTPDSPEPDEKALEAEASETPDLEVKSKPSYKDGAAETRRPRLLLTPAAVPALEKFLGLPPSGSFASDVYRALEQARLRLEAGGR